MFCKECGAQIADNVRFCGKCGTKVEVVTNPGAGSAQESAAAPVSILQGAPIPASTSQGAPKPSGGKRKVNRAVIIAAAAVAVIAVLTAVFVAMGGVDKANVLWQMNTGNRYLDDMEYEEAIAAFEAAITIDPSEEKAYIGLADAYVGLGDYEAAVRALQEGIRETGSDALWDYLQRVQEEWDERERRVCGGVYSVDTDLDDTNNTGIPNAEISVTDSQGNTVTCHTDSQGHYDTEHLSKGAYTVHFSAEGYVEYEEEVSLTGGKYEWNVYLEPDTRATLYGSVLIADEDTDYSNNSPLGGVRVSLEKLNGSNEFSATGISDENGQYIISNLLMGVYNLTASMPGYLPVEQTLIIYPGQNVSYNTLIEAIREDWRGTGTASGTIYDALTGNGVAGLTLRIRKGINNTDGDVLETIETDSYGRYMTPALESGNYSVEISDDRPGVEVRYLGTSINVKTLGGMNIDNQDGTVSNTIQTGQMRIVLTWGATPADLDSHLECYMNSGEGYHIFYGDRTFYSGGESMSDRIADLDLDDVDSYGPETTTIYRSDPGKYLFWVHNFTGDSEYGLAGSGACVQVYMGYSAVPTYVFYVPNAPGYGWEVFGYDSETGVLTPSNRMYENYDYWYGGEDWYGGGDDY